MVASGVRGNGWAWFFGGTTLSLAVILGALLWALGSTGMYGDLLARVRAGGAPRVLNPPPLIAPAPGAPAASGEKPSSNVKVGELVSSANWKLVIDGSRSESTSDGSRVLVDFTVKNDGD